MVFDVAASISRCRCGRRADARGSRRRSCTRRISRRAAICPQCGVTAASASRWPVLRRCRDDSVKTGSTRAGGRHLERRRRTRGEGSFLEIRRPIRGAGRGRSRADPRARPDSRTAAPRVDTGTRRLVRIPPCSRGIAEVRSSSGDRVRRTTRASAMARRPEDEPDARTCTPTQRVARNHRLDLLRQTETEVSGADLARSVVVPVAPAAAQRDPTRASGIDRRARFLFPVSRARLLGATRRGFRRAGPAAGGSPPCRRSPSLRPASIA